MFTGLVEEKGALLDRVLSGESARLKSRSHMKDLVVGESIAVDGVCLTVVREIAGGGFEADASSETLAKTTLGTVAKGGAVNLERAVRVGAPLGGHIVTGHVDGRARVEARRMLGDAIELTFRAPNDLARYVAPKGSIAVNGVSLTVNHVRDPEAASDVQATLFDVVIIPHTQSATTLDTLHTGDLVNIEVDVLARYVARLLDAGRAPHLVNANANGESADASWLDRLQRAGYV
jgi:riboflavin synthase